MTDVDGADGVDGADDPGGSARPDAERPRESMRDVDHTPPHGDRVADIWRRGTDPDRPDGGPDAPESAAGVPEDEG